MYVIRKERRPVPLLFLHLHNILVSQTSLLNVCLTGPMYGLTDNIVYKERIKLGAQHFMLTNNVLHKQLSSPKFSLERKARALGKLQL